MGIVYLVGAGPGDPGLITVKGKDRIEQADCIVYDRLASPELLAYAKSSCEIIYVGKENHHHTMKQDEINALLVKKAEEHETVVRLKGGDVYVFGRGGEEGIYMREHGVDFEVVPGISSALAGLAYAGIPITHRGMAMGFHVVTAHNKRDQLADIDFETMVRGTDTNVFLMGLSKLPEIVVKLVSAGMTKEMPVAVISHATMKEQKTCVGTLDTIVEKVEEAGLTSPALIVVGNVIRLREQLNFWEKKDCFGKKVLVPRIGKERSTLSIGLDELGADVVDVQVGEILPIQDAFSAEQMEAAIWIVLTSKNGVESFFEEVRRQKIDHRIFAQKKFAVIGEKTKEALEEKGFYADLMPKTYTSEALCELLAAKVSKEDTIFYGHPSGLEMDGISKLEEACNVEWISLYENQDCSPECIDAAGCQSMCFTCASSVRRVWELLNEGIREKMMDGKIEVFSIGPKTTKELENYGIMNIREAQKATIGSMLEDFVLKENKTPASIDSK